MTRFIHQMDTLQPKSKTPSFFFPPKKCTECLITVLYSSRSTCSFEINIVLCIPRTFRSKNKNFRVFLAFLHHLSTNWNWKNENERPESWKLKTDNVNTACWHHKPTGPGATYPWLRRCSCFLRRYRTCAWTWTGRSPGGERWGEPWTACGTEGGPGLHNTSPNQVKWAFYQGPNNKWSLRL